jgi:hypothetical protein
MPRPSRRRGPPLIEKERLQALATPVMRVVASLLVIACLAVIARRIAGSAKADERYAIDPAVLIGESLPSWLPIEVARSLRADLEHLRARSIFDPDLVPSLTAELAAASPWIAGVRGIERVFPDQARAELEIRRPVIRFAAAGFTWLAAEDGLLLHQEGEGGRLEFPFPVLEVIGALPSRTPRLGEPLVDAPLRSAAAVAAELLTIPEPDSSVFWSLKPVALDVEVSRTLREASPDEIFIRFADSPALLRWGRAASGDLGRVGVDRSRKLRNLRALIEVFPKLNGLAEIRLDYPEPCFRQIGFDRGLEFLAAEPAPAAGFR